MKTLSKAIKILVVEDEIFTKNIICEIISNLGHQCESASSISEAIKLVSSFEPNLVITDLDFGNGPTGLDLVTKLDRDFPDIQIAVLTAHSSPNMVDANYKHLPARVQYVIKSQIDTSNTFKQLISNAIENKTDFKRTSQVDKKSIYLSKTQAELLKLIAQGFSNQAIADKRGTTLRAVEALINRTYQVLNLTENSSINLRVEAVKLWKSSHINVK